MSLASSLIYSLSSYLSLLFAWKKLQELNKYTILLDRWKQILFVALVSSYFKIFLLAMMVRSSLILSSLSMIIVPTKCTLGYKLIYTSSRHFFVFVTIYSLPMGIFRKIPAAAYWRWVFSIPCFSQDFHQFSFQNIPLRGWLATVAKLS